MKLDKLWQQIDSCKSCKGDLQHILGAGAENPDLMIVFINPTKRNISSDKDWTGHRFPFIGRKRPWDIFHKVGWIDNDLFDGINQNENNWSYEFTGKVLDSLKSRKLYLTNIVKCTGEDATLPTTSKINSQLHLFEKEVALVNPKVIISFGLLPTKALLKQDVKMSELYKEVLGSRKPKLYEIKINGKAYKVSPCYYPIGRGNPKQAVEMLEVLNYYINKSN